MYGDGVPMENAGRSWSPALLHCAPQVTPTDPRRPPRTRTTTPRTWSSSTEEGAFVAVVFAGVLHVVYDGDLLARALRQVGAAA
ncbi:hypothetical protein ACQJBY_038735 [Aegilops geniculata]